MVEGPKVSEPELVWETVEVQRARVKFHVLTADGKVVSTFGGISLWPSEEDMALAADNLLKEAITYRRELSDPEVREELLADIPDERERDLVRQATEVPCG